MRTLLTATLLAAALALPLAARAEEPAADARLAVREALAEKAGLPALRPSLPSLLSDRDGLAARGDRRDDDQAASDEAGKAALPEQARGHAAAARREAAAAAAAAEADQRGASEQARVKKAKKEHGKPPHPPHPVN